MRKLSSVFALAVATAFCSCISDNKSSQSVNTDNEVLSKNNVVETILSRRSIRKYKPQEVEESKLDQILECGINAPNGMGRESWEIRVVKNPELLAQIDSLNRQFSVSGGADPAKVRPAAYGAPVLIFIANDTTYDLSQVDCGLLGANMILTAQSMNLGTCCLGGIVRFMRSPQASDLLKKLDLPENYNLLYAIALGYPDESPKAKPRNFEKIRYIE